MYMIYMYYETFVCSIAIVGLLGVRIVTAHTKIVWNRKIWGSLMLVKPIKYNFSMNDEWVAGLITQMLALTICAPIKTHRFYNPMFLSILCTV